MTFYFVSSFGRWARVPIATAEEKSRYGGMGTDTHTHRMHVWVRVCSAHTHAHCRGPLCKWRTACRRYSDSFGRKFKTNKQTKKRSQLNVRLTLPFTFKCCLSSFFLLLSRSNVLASASAAILFVFCFSYFRIDEFS